MEHNRNREDLRSKKKPNEDNELKPDPETLHTTDPQEEMKGPVSSAMRKIEKTLKGHETKKEANEKRDKHM